MPVAAAAFPLLPIDRARRGVGFSCKAARQGVAKTLVPRDWRSNFRAPLALEPWSNPMGMSIQRQARSGGCFASHVDRSLRPQ